MYMKNKENIRKKTTSDDLMQTVKREQRRNYVILYIAVLLVWLILMLVSLNKGYFSMDGFIVDVIHNIVGILPPILIFDFFN